MKNHTAKEIAIDKAIYNIMNYNNTLMSFSLWEKEREETEKEREKERNFLKELWFSDEEINTKIDKMISDYYFYIINHY